jgi:hypothetical protein
VSDIFVCKCGAQLGPYAQILAYIQANPTNRCRCGTCKAVVVWRLGKLYWLPRKERRALEAKGQDWKPIPVKI